MDRELNLPLTTRETVIVKVVLIRLRDEKKRCIRAMKNSNAVSNVSDYERDLKDINSILDKIERMTDG